MESKRIQAIKMTIKRIKIRETNNTERCYRASKR